jgi:diguanylate cyclase (GGDEF)-like protein/PAS domain S-box-containing protein
MPQSKNPSSFSSEGLGEELFDLERARQRERQLRLEAEGLLEGLRALTAAMDTQQVFERLVGVLRGFVPFQDAIMLQLAGPGQLESVYATSSIYRGLRWPVGRMLHRVLDGQTVSVFDTHSVPDWGCQPVEITARVRSAIHTPVHTETRNAVLIFVHAQVAAFDKGHVRLIERFAPLTNQALASIEYRERLDREQCLVVTANEAALREITERRLAEQKLRGLFDLAPLGIALADLQGHYVEFNQAFLRICGYSAEELKALDYRTLTPEKYRADDARQSELLLKTGRFGPYEKEYIRKDGSLVNVRINGIRITLNDGQTYGWSIYEDITESKQTETNLRVAAAAFEAQVGIIVMDSGRNILSVNKAFTEISGYSAEEVVGGPTHMLRSGRHDDVFFIALWDCVKRTGTWQGEIWGRRKKGEVFPGWMVITAVKGSDGVITHYVSTQIDITENKVAEESIRQLAFYDSLTGLPNRRLLQDRLQQAMAASTRSGRAGALLFIDLDHFKTLNDTLGHDKGDLLLEQVAARLLATVRESDTVARLGGDEFVIMQEGLSESFHEAAAQAKTLGEKLLAAFSMPFQIGDYEQFSTASIGVALFQDHHDKMGDLLKWADLAMYQAKAAGRNAMRFFDPDMQAVVNARAALEADLRHALRRQEFLLYYQPQVDADGRMTGAEALVRWRHPKRGMVSPADFVPLAEDTGQILPLGQWVLETACRQLVEWAQYPLSSRLDMAVNISARQFYHPDFVQQVLATVEYIGADPGLLKLELTESVLLTNYEEIIGKMSALKARGIRFSLDDFGTGYSSLSYLKRLPLDQLKIDQSFVRDILTDHNDASIAKTIVALGHSLGLSVIAEGVETEEQLTFLAVNGCNAYQGYLFSQPLSADDLEMFVAMNC